MSLSPPAGSQLPFWLPNPFTDLAVGSVWDAEAADVPDIHADVFNDLLKMVRQRRRGIHDRCSLLYGYAGSGKTHLIRRLRFALQVENEPTVFAWARMQTSPLMMWRHLRRSLARDLLQAGSSGHRQIQHLTSNAAEKIDSIENRSLAVVLEHLASHNHQRDARAWLMGDRLPDSALGLLGIAANDEEESLEDESRRIICEIALLLKPIPLVLCLDQLEALQSYPGDKTGLFAIGNVMAALHDEAPNAVVIGCVQTGLIGELSANLSVAALDRFRQLPLEPLTPHQIHELVLARLNSHPEIARARPAGASEFWPIDISRIERLAASPEGATARKVIFECDRTFRAFQGKPSVQPSPDNFLQEQYQARLDAAQQALRADTSAAILSDGLPRLLHLRGIGVNREGLPRWMDHAAASPGQLPTGIVIANDSPRSLWRRLDRIKQEWNPAAQRLVVIRDILNPLAAKGSQERLKDLEKRGATVLSPSREALCALDAVRQLLADSESGDLVLGGDSIPATTVEDWIRRQLPETLDRLAAQIGEPVPADRTEESTLFRELAALIADKKIAAVAELAKLLNRSAQEIEHCVRDNPEALGLAGGVEPAVFERLPFETGA